MLLYGLALQMIVHLILKSFLLSRSCQMYLDSCGLFAVFDMENFYPSITEKLLTDSIIFAKKYIDITDRDIDIIMHSRKSLLFDSNFAWVKKNNSSFDVTMGSYDGAEVCELVGLFILNRLSNEYGKENIEFSLK